MEMIEKEKEFFKCLQNLEAPALSERDYVTCTDAESLRKAAMLIDLKQKIKEMQIQEEDLKQELIGQAGSSNMKIGNLSVSKVVKKGNIQYKNIDLLKGVDLEPYRLTSSTYWRIG